MKESYMSYGLDVTKQRSSLMEEKVSFFLCCLVIAVLSIALPISWLHGKTTIVSQDVLLSFYINEFIALAALFSSSRNHSFSLVQFHWVFFLMFFVLAPLQQYLNRYWPWGTMISDDEIISTNIMLLAWGFVYEVGNRFSPIANHLVYKSKRSGVYISETRMFVLIMFSFACIVALVLTDGVSALFARSLRSTATSSTIGLIQSCFLRAVPLFCFLFILIDNLKSGKRSPMLFISAILVLLACFPTGAARFLVAGVYLGLLLFVLEYRRCQKGYIALIVILGMLVVFPLINVFRYYSFSDGISRLLNDPLYPMKNGFLSGNFDAYSMLIEVEHYVILYGNTCGRQLLGAALFFVPRSIWSSKPIITGPMVFETFGRSFTNVSTSIPAEAYIDFGSLGVIVVAFLLGRLCRCIDDIYWRDTLNDRLSFIRLYYPFLLPLFFFTMRGSLMAGYPYIVGFGVVCFVLFRVLSLEGLRSECNVSAFRHADSTPE